MAGEVQRDARDEDKRKADRAFPQQDQRVFVERRIDLEYDKDIVAEVVGDHADDRDGADDVYQVVTGGRNRFGFHMDYCSGWRGICKEEFMRDHVKKRKIKRNRYCNSDRAMLE